MASFKKITIVDILTGAVAGIFLGIVLSRLVPELLDTNLWWWVVLAVLLLLRPLYRSFTGRGPVANQ